MWRSEWRFHVFLLQLIFKNSWYEVCLVTKHEKRQAESCKKGRNKNKFLCDLRKVLYKPNWHFSVFAALTAAEHQRLCSTLNTQWSAVEPEVIIWWCHWLNDGFVGLARVLHKEVQVLCWMRHMRVLKASGNISKKPELFLRGGRSTFASTTFWIYYRQKKEKKTLFFVFSCKLWLWFDMTITHFKPVVWIICT